MKMKDIEERLNVIERKQAIIETMINHLNNLMTSNIINKIEFDVEMAAKNIVAERDVDTDNTAANTKSKVVSIKMDEGLNG